MAFDKVSKACNDVLENIATEFERVNGFAQLLRKKQCFSSVITGTDIRVYTAGSVPGWNFEKYVEAVIDKETGLAAIWWFELGEEKERWSLSGNTSISYGDYDESFATQYADTVEALISQMKLMLDNLLQTYDPHQNFRKEIDRIMSERQSLRQGNA